MEQEIESFERDWVRGEPPSIFQRLEQARSRTGKPAAAERLALELALVDIEFRWRSGTAGRTRKSAWYRMTFKLSDASVEQLAWHELLVRSCWGDRPSIDSVVEQLPHPEETAAVLHQLLQRRFPLYLLVRSTVGDSSLEVPLVGKVVIGRQRTGDPLPLGCRTAGREQGLPVTRVIIADELDSSTSRTQIILRRASVDEIELQAARRGTAALLDEQRLASEQTHRIRVASEVVLGSHRISLRGDW